MGKSLIDAEMQPAIVLSTLLRQPDSDAALDSGCGHPWFAVRVRSNYERIAAAYLRAHGYDEFQPGYTTERRWSDRKKEINQPLFPGYVFCRLDPANRLPVLKAPGVVDLVGFAKIPAPIPDHEIESIRRMVQSGLLVLPWPVLEVGNSVLIERGPLAGVEGVLYEVKGKCRLVVSVNLLQRAVSAEVDRSWVRPMPGTARGSLASIQRPARIA